MAERFPKKSSWCWDEEEKEGYEEEIKKKGSRRNKKEGFEEEIKQ